MQYTTKQGKKITGTLETVEAIAEIDGIDQNGEPIHSGTTNILWDTQKTNTSEGGDVLYVCEDGETHYFRDLVPNKIVD